MSVASRLAYHGVMATVKLGHGGPGGRFYMRHVAPALFIHINKTGGTSIEAALGLPPLHRTAVDIRADVGEAIWNDKVSFAVVRNPWDRVASQYRYRSRKNTGGLADGHLPFTEWVRRSYEDRDPRYRKPELMFVPQLDWIADENGRIIVDRVLRFESIEKEFAELCVDLELDVTLPHLRRSPDQGLSEYDDRAAEIVGHEFAGEIERFGYSFDGSDAAA